ncbi:zinc transporter [Alteromonadaceae bacterium 2753L.S.0a.02]|nr:zinc transporter [Alteromonadaceae bacterium 2753L.S.0a.02]
MPDDIHYGSDETGLVWGYHFTKDSAATPISSSQVEHRLAQLAGTDAGFVWLHFSLANSATLRWLKQNLQLPESFYESLHGQAGSTRLELEGESLVAVINDVMYDFSVDSSEISSGRLYIDRNLVISVRLRPLRSIEQLKSNVRDGKRFTSTISLLAQLLEDQVSVLVSILRKQSVRIDGIEDKLLANRMSFQRGELGSIRRVLVRLQRLLAPEPAAFFRLINRPPHWIEERDLFELRQAAEEFSLAVGDTTNLIERVKILQEELAALVNEQSNRTLSILTLVTVLALPINLTAGLFGMNVSGIPFEKAHHGFLLVAGSICAFTLTLATIVLRRTRE